MASHGKGIHEADQAKIIAMEVLEGLQRWSAIAVQDTDASVVGGPFDICDTPPDGFGDFEDEWKDEKPVGAADYKVTWVLDCEGNPFNTAVVTVKWKKSGKTHNIDVTGVIR
jgi:hypothetical protein